MTNTIKKTNFRRQSEKNIYLIYNNNKALAEKGNVRADAVFSVLLLKYMKKVV
jgi:hypothetical protein